MSYYFSLAVLILIIGFAIIVLAIFSILKQKVYLDKEGNPIGSEIEIPLFGKVKTSLPAVALAFLGAVVVFIAADLMKSSQPELITFTGTVTVDRMNLDNIPDIIIVGLAPGDGGAFKPVKPENRTQKVELKVPNSWSSYILYAFAPGLRAQWIGIPADEPFTLELTP